MSTGRILAMDGRPRGEHRVLDGLLIAAAEWGEGPETNMAWQMVAVEGKWDGHWMGSFKLDGAMFDQMVQGFESSPIDTVVDYEHASVFGDSQAPAAGWIKALERRAVDQQQTLWARIAWTQRAADYIRASEYRYLSPTIVFNSRDRKSGKMAGARLMSVALTNVPFLHELPEVRLNSLRAALTHHQEDDPMNPEQFKALCVALKLDPEKATAEQVMEALAARDLTDAIIASVREALGVEPDGDIVVAARAAKVAATAAPPDEMAALRVQVQTLQAQQAQRTAAEIVSACQRQGKVQADATENHKACMTWAQRDPAGFSAYMATVPAGSVSPVVGPLALVGASGRTTAGEDGDPEVAALGAKYRASLGLTDDDVKAAKASGGKFNL
jgi:phage I-like protein